MYEDADGERWARMDVTDPLPAPFDTVIAEPTAGDFLCGVKYYSGGAHIKNLDAIYCNLATGDSYNVVVL